VTEPIRVDPHIVHVVYGEVLHPVIYSQVVEPLVTLAARGLTVELVVYISPRALISGRLRRLHRARLQELKRRIPGRVTFLTVGPRHSLRALSSARLARRQRQSLRGGVPVIVHARGPRAANLAVPVSLRYQRAGVIYDCRGAQAEEYRHGRGRERQEDESTLEAGVRGEAREERRAASDADRIFAVSEPLADYLAETYDVPREEIRVVRPLVDTTHFRVDEVARQALRQELQLREDDLVLVFSGGYASWQLPGVMAQLALAVRQADPQVVLLILSPDGERYRQVALEAGLPESALRVQAVPHDLMPRYLAAGDAGLLLREPSPVNRLSGPVKFAEYLACGLPVVISDGVGDASERVAREHAGVVLASHAPEELARVRQRLLELGDRQIVAQRCAALAARDHSRHLAVEAYVAEYQALSDRLAGWRSG
jgi:glycosyltransferase involved in cell wall biosynthesis